MFLDGCGLPEAWAGRRRFVVGELGFGTGLNIAALLDLWARARPPGGQLHVFSVEAHPIATDEAVRALAHWPELAPIAGLLLARWPGRARGVHRVDLPELGAVLDVAVRDVGRALAGWTGKADAWFLDGFAPALNPAMWTDEVLGLIAARSAPGARAATFTVAGAVRRGLTAAGFEAAKRPGFGRKRERLEARLPSDMRETPAPRRVAIVGGGIAGAAAARAVRDLGAEALVIEAEALGAGGSGNPAALVTPRLDAGLEVPAELFAAAFRRAAALYELVPGGVLARGTLQLAQAERDVARFAKIAASDLFEPGDLRRLTPGETTGRLGEPSPAALELRSALVVEPRSILPAWAGDTLIATVASLAQDADGWRLLDGEGAEIARADAVILAAGQATAALAPGLPLQPVRGQASWVAGAPPPMPAAWGGYVLPTRDGLLFGATHDRDDEGLDIRQADHERNRATLAAAMPALAGRIAGGALEGRARTRATTPDRLPIAGALDGQDLFVLTGFGSRGFSLAPLLAEHVAALALGAPSPLGAELAAIVAPDRFARRAARRSPLSKASVRRISDRHGGRPDEDP